MANKPETDEKQVERLKLIEEKIQQGLKPHPFLMGKKNRLGNHARLESSRDYWSQAQTSRPVLVS